MIGWKDFAMWSNNVRDEPGYEWLAKVYDIWNKEKEVVDWREKVKMIDSELFSDSDFDDLLAYLLNNARTISWNEFDEWVKEVEEKDGYEWIHSFVEEYKERRFAADWSFFDDKEGELNIHDLAIWLHNNRYEIDAEHARNFLFENNHRINWDDFDEWATVVWN